MTRATRGRDNLLMVSGRPPATRRPRPPSVHCGLGCHSHGRMSRGGGSAARATVNVSTACIRRHHPGGVSGKLEGIFGGGRRVPVPVWRARVTVTGLEDSRMILAAKRPGTFAAGSAVQRPLRLCTVRAGLSGGPVSGTDGGTPAGVERLEKPRLGDSPAPWLTALTAVQLCPPVIS